MDETDIRLLAIGQGAQTVDIKIVDLYQYYGLQPAAGAIAKLSVYAPDVLLPGRTRPAVLILPGGGYEHVSWREAEPVALRFAAMGYGAFVLDYSVAPLRFPTALREAALAMRFIREHAAEFSVESNMVAAIGFSAGGHLCGCLGMLYDCPELKDIGPAQLLRPDALGLCYPVAVSWGRTHAGSFDNLCGEDEALRQRLSLERCVRTDMPPVFLWHTREDGSVACRNSLLLAQALEEAQIPFALHLYHRGPHGLSTADALVYPVQGVPAVSRDVPGWVDAMAEFFWEMGFTIRDKENGI